MSEILNERDLAELRKWDTPSVCNAIEILAPERRTRGFTLETLICNRPEYPPMVGYARTAVFRAMHVFEHSEEEETAKLLDYYQYVEDGPRPSIVVLQDIDPIPGYGSFWGEVNSNIHKGLGAIGTITNGCVRDVPVCAEGFQFMSAHIRPSHAWDRIVAFGGEVTVAGMEVKSGDLIHADQHGAVVIPHAVARRVPEACALIARKEAVLIEAARKPGFSVRVLREAMGKQADIH
jgi:regulator of RNase E activity RraA